MGQLLQLCKTLDQEVLHSIRHLACCLRGEQQQGLLGRTPPRGRGADDQHGGVCMLKNIQQGLL
jgi:hypothetical protein